MRSICCINFPNVSDSFTFRLQSQPDYSQPDPNDSNSVGPLADVESWRVTLEVARALATAQARGLRHGALAPRWVLRGLVAM